MSHAPIDRSADLKALVDDGYEVSISSGYLLISGVPYVNDQKQVKRGTLVSALTLAGDVAVRPADHTVLFAGEFPCHADGSALEQIRAGGPLTTRTAAGLSVPHQFSSKPSGGYADYYVKMTAYANILESAAIAIEPTVTARTRRVMPSSDPNSVFLFEDVSISHAGIDAAAKKYANHRIAIVGLGGSGAYVLDYVAKIAVKAIHTFDGDEYLQHNAMRSPGATSSAELEAVPKKVHFHANRYQHMRRGIIPHPYHIDATNVHELAEMDFVFLCIDDSQVKAPIFAKLEEFGVPFVDVGMGLVLVDDKIQGIARVTTSTPKMRAHIRDHQRVSMANGNDDDPYSSNIQTVELNGLNAALAVIKWKKLIGFYHDNELEHSCTYTLDGNMLINDDLQ